ncbi:MAG: hypothetical protein ACI85F_001085 [Bacteroidia bacterium]
MRYLQITILVIITSVFGCKDPELVGLDTIADADGLNLEQVDTFTVVGSYFLTDTNKTSNLNSYLLGGMNDPVLGKVSSKLYAQFHIGGSNVTFPPDAIVDSVVVYLKYAGSYGSTNRFSGFQTINVHRLDEDIYEDSIYTQNSSHDLGALVGSVGFRPDLYDGTTLIFGTDTLELAPHLRIPLDNSFGQEILTSNALASDSLFVTVFKGLAFVPETDALPEGHGAMLYCNTPNPETRLRIYYHESGSLEQDVFNLYVGTLGAAHTSFHHEYPQGILDDTSNTTVGEQNLYIQAAGGIGTRINFPGLINLLKDDAGNRVNIAINKAELIFPIEAETFSDLSPPLRLDLRIQPIDTLEVQIPTIDGFAEDVNYFGGAFDSDALEYKFNIARQLQWFLNQEIEFPELRVYVEDQKSTGYRGILNGTKHPLRPIKLRVTFTRIE